MRKLSLIPLLGLFLPSVGMAVPIAIATAGDVTITLHDDDCRMKDVVINLPRRAVWRENGKDIEGCYTFIQQIGLLTFYFADKTVAAAPAQMFKRASGA